MLDLTRERDRPDWEILEQIRWLEMELEERGIGPRSTAEPATMQDLQLEIIRRSSFNNFDGPIVYRNLIERRALWKAALLDRLWPEDQGGLIKLRDLPDGLWNADTLYVVGHDEASARAIARLEKQWRCDSVVVNSARATRNALGDHARVSRERLVTFWWD